MADDEAAAEPQPAGPSVHLRYIHSDIFERLVTEEDDLFGLVAYGLYQQQKRTWIKNFEKDRGRTPNEQEVKDYCYTYHDGVLGDLNTKASTIIFGVSENLLEDRIPEMEKTAFNAKASEELVKLNTKIDHISGYRHHIVGHVIGFIVLVALAWGVLFILNHEPRIADFLGITHEPVPDR